MTFEKVYLSLPPHGMCAWSSVTGREREGGRGRERERASERERERVRERE